MHFHGVAGQLLYKLHAFKEISRIRNEGGLKKTFYLMDRSVNWDRGEIMSAQNYQKNFDGMKREKKHYFKKCFNIPQKKSASKV